MTKIQVNINKFLNINQDYIYNKYNFIKNLFYLLIISYLR
jgi:hypothetical protein